MEVTMNVKKFMDSIGLNQQQLADELDTCNQNVNRWVKNKGTPSYEMCQKLLSIGMLVEDLFDVNYNEIHHLVKEDREPTEIKEDEFRLRWMKMMKEWNEQQH